MARILAVDDERAILDAFERMLSRAGHEVTGVEDPARFQTWTSRASISYCAT